MHVFICSKGTAPRWWREMFISSSLKYSYYISWLQRLNERWRFRYVMELGIRKVLLTLPSGRYIWSLRNASCFMPPSRKIPYLDSRTSVQGYWTAAWAFPSTNHAIAGRSLCLEAFVILFSQEESWCLTTRQVELVSLDFCLTFRATWNGHLKVKPQTPKYFWKRGSKRPITRLPVLRPRSVLWGMPGYTLGSMNDTFEDLDLFVFYPPANDKWRRLGWPRGLQKLEFGYRFNTSLVNSSWPASLRVVIFSCTFNQPIKDVAWPAALERLTLGCYFDQPVDKVTWPASLQELDLGGFYESTPPDKPTIRGSFNHPVHRVVWPTSLHRLTLGSSFNQPIDRVCWAPSLLYIAFGSQFNQPIDAVKWPPSLLRLSFGSNFSQPLEQVAWPASLQNLILGNNFIDPIREVGLPTSLLKLVFLKHFNHPIEGVVWPASLQDLTFGRSFNHPVRKVAWPSSLQRITFGIDFKHSIEGVAWPNSLRRIKIGYQSITPTINKENLAKCHSKCIWRRSRFLELVEWSFVRFIESIFPLNNVSWAVLAYHHFLLILRKKPELGTKEC